MSEAQIIPATALDRAIQQAGGKSALARKLNELGHTVKSQATVYQWTINGVPAEYCPDIEAITGIACELLRPDVNWSVLRRTVKA